MTREYTANRSTGWQQWSATTLWICLLVAGALGFLAVGWEMGPQPLFLLGVTGGLLAVSTIVGWLISRTADGQPITLATMITLSRGAALAVFSGFLVVGPPTGPFEWIPAMLFALAAGLDFVDGRIARATDSVSELGARLDTEIDGLTVLLGTLYVVTTDLVPAVFLLVGVARYVFVLGIAVRNRLGLAVEALPPSQLRRVLGGLAMGSIWLALLPISGPAVSRLVAIVVLVPFLVNFSRDWLAVSGRR
jgi:CDP-diacylglycerol--glycerol-3-phosphate 3-phosphatidyltransferase